MLLFSSENPTFARYGFNKDNDFSRNAIFLAAIFVAGLASAAQPAAPRKSRQTREEYIDKYKSIAVRHMERYGIPASITMAQGILESDCGNSRLSVQSNNHFGIKCKRGWQGETVYHDDDAPGECFRAYPSVEASFLDHAEFLDRQPRYDSLFAYSSSDYKSWARGLKAAGYATAPDYAQRLVRIIEENELYLLDRNDGERLYASRTGGRTDPEAWFSEQTSVETAAASTSLIDPDDYRVTINAHCGYDVYATNGVHYIPREGGRHVRAPRRAVPPRAAQPAQVQRPDRQAGAAHDRRGDLHRAQAQALGGQCPPPPLPRGRDGLRRGTVLRDPHPLGRAPQPPQARRAAPARAPAGHPLIRRAPPRNRPRTTATETDMETTPLRAKILETIVRKSTLKQKVFDNTFAAFNFLKETLFEMASEMDDELDGRLDRRVRLEYRDRGKFERSCRWPATC